MQEAKTRPDSIKEVMDRYPRLSAHMICESLGYFTPEAAAHAILHYLQGHPFYCEWYMHMAGGEKSADRIRDLGTKVIERAFKERHHHQGFMAHYPAARALVEEVRGGGEGPVFMSW